MTPERLQEIENSLAAAFWIGGPTAVFAQNTREVIQALREAQGKIENYDKDRAEWDKAAERMEILMQRLVAARSEAWKERDEAKAELERLSGRLDSAQDYIDAVCHYRNLAIVLGAKPEQMLGTFDRELCAGGLDPDETSGGYHISINQQLEELNDVWAELDAAKAQLETARTQAVAAIDLANDLWCAAPDEYFWDHDDRLMALTKAIRGSDDVAELEPAKSDPGSNLAHTPEYGEERIKEALQKYGTDYVHVDLLRKDPP